jgi:hypothetical protein
VLFTKTVLRAAVRKALVRVRGENGAIFLACCKESALEVLRDTGEDLELLFEECVFGSAWALKALPLERFAQCQRDSIPPWLPREDCAQVWPLPLC